MMDWFSLAFSIFALVVAVTFFVRAELRWRRQKKADQQAKSHRLAGRGAPGADEWVFMGSEDQKDLAEPHLTTMKVGIDPDTYDPDDLTKGDGDFSFRDHPVDTERERAGNMLPEPEQQD